MNNCFLNRKVPFVHIEPNYTKFNRVEVGKDGVLSSSCQFVEYSSIEDIYSYEFSLGNLISIGAVSGMQYVSMSLNSDMNFVDEFAESYKSVKSNVEETSKS